MGLIFDREIPIHLKRSFKSASSIKLITAYLTSGIFTVFNKEEIEIKDISLCVRGNKQDFFNNTVCIKTIKELYKLGVKCYLVRNLHIKAYIFDDEEIYIGSANLTNNGLSISASSNIEVLYKADCIDNYIVELNKVLHYSVAVTDKIIKEIEESLANFQLTKIKPENLDSIDWSFWDIEDYISHLNYSVLPKCDLSIPILTQDKEKYFHDSLLFGLKEDGTFDRSLFITSTLHHFLVKEVLARGEGKQLIRFGELKNLLMEKLSLDEPCAKETTKNIFSYYRDKKCLPLNYERYRYTESLKLEL